MSFRCHIVYHDFLSIIDYMFKNSSNVLAYNS